MALTQIKNTGIADNAITLAKMADNSVGTSELVPDAVTAVKIDDDGTGFTLGSIVVDTNTLIADATNNRVGIGTASPEGQLSFDASDSDTPKIRFQNAASVTGDAALSTYEDSLGTSLLIGSNVITGSGGAISRFNTSEESCGIQLNRTGVIQFYTGGTGANPTVTATLDTSGNFTASSLLTGDLVLKSPTNKGHYTIWEEEEYLAIKNERTGKNYKFVLEEISE